MAVTEPRASTATAAGEEPFVITRIFDAPRDLVFRLWSEAEHLKCWFGTKEFPVVSCENDLRPGGFMHYRMRGPGGEEMWGKWVYREIVRPERLVFVDSFSDEVGNITRHALEPDWPQEILSTVTFAENKGSTMVTVEWAPLAATELERKTFQAGRESMRMGWTGTLDRLTEYLARIE